MPRARFTSVVRPSLLRCSYKHFNPYYAWILLFSQVWAITCLVFLFEATLEWLKPMRPFLKFVTVKGMVFFAWMQMEFIGA